MPKVVAMAVAVVDQLVGKEDKTVAVARAVVVRAVARAVSKVLEALEANEVVAKEKEAHRPHWRIRLGAVGRAVGKKT